MNSISSIAQQEKKSKKATDRFNIKSPSEKYIDFLDLISEYPHELSQWVPNKEIDRVVHERIASNQFSKDCQKIFGKDVELAHNAGFGMGDDRNEWLAAFQLTKARFEQHFGPGSMGDSMPAACNLLIKSK